VTKTTLFASFSTGGWTFPLPRSRRSASAADEYNNPMTERLLPLFPLQVVLFPRTEILFHIFEERYKEMIGECLETGSEFGIVLVLEQGLASTGCTATVAQLIRKFDDGRMDILVRGRRRFDLARLDQERSFLRGEPQFFDDDGGEVPPADAKRQQALRLYQQVAEKLSSERRKEPPPAPEAADPQLSFQIASRLPVELTFRQLLLQLRSETIRLERLIPYLEKMAAQLARVSEVQAKAGSNGRAH